MIKIILSFMLLLILVSCGGLALKGKMGTDNDKNEAIKNTVPQNSEFNVAYFHRPEGSGNNALTMSVWLNDVAVAKLRANQFTKIELPPGKHRVEMGFYEDKPPSRDPRYDQPMFQMVKQHMSHMATVIQVPLAAEGPLVVPIRYNEVGPQNIHFFDDGTTIGKDEVDKLSNFIYKYIFPEVAVMDHAYISDEDRNEWKSYANTTSISSLDFYIAKNPLGPYVIQAKQRKKVLTEEQNADFVIAKNENSLKSYSAYLDRFPDAFNKIDVYALMTGKMQDHEDYVYYAQRHEGITKYYPNDVRISIELMNLGPEGMKVKDILVHLNDGLGAPTLAAKIKATNSPYKDFSISEIKFLKKKGVVEVLISAMIESTTQYDRQMKQISQNEEMMAKIKELIGQSQKNMQVTSNWVSAADKNLPVECLKLKTALMACDQAGGFLGIACKVTAKSSFNCSIDL